MAIDLSLDYHSHILPGCDHGSDSIETSLQQIGMAKNAGIKTICATSHFYPDKESIYSFVNRRNDAYKKLVPYLNDDSPKVQLGAEVLICSGMEKMDDLTELCRENTNELLLEMPFYEWSEDLWTTIYNLKDREDINIILAHADRYSTNDVVQLAEDGIKLQLNVEGICKIRKRHRCIEWIKRGYVSYLGSDIHMLGENYEDWVKAKKILKRIN